MSMLSEQCARLRSWARQFDERSDIDALAPLLASDLREAADTIISLEAECDEWKRKIEILKAHGVEIVDAVAGGFEVYNEAVRERDEWKAEAKSAKQQYHAQR